MNTSNNRPKHPPDTHDFTASVSATATHNQAGPDYWGFWASLAFAMVVFMAFSMTQIIVFALYASYLNPGGQIQDLHQIINTLSLDGFALSLAEIPSSLFGISLVILFASLRKHVSWIQYLTLFPVKLRTIINWVGIMLLAIMMMELANYVLQRDTPEFMTRVFSSTQYPLLLWLAVIVAAPFFEEFLFRGFLLEGFRHTLLGNNGAVLITAAAWAVIHIQYEWPDIFSIFLVGIVLGVARLKTGSLYVPIAMHAMMNFLASLMMTIFSNETMPS